MIVKKTVKVLLLSRMMLELVLKKGNLSKEIITMFHFCEKFFGTLVLSLLFCSHHLPIYSFIYIFLK